MKKTLNFIALTSEGSVIERVPICEYNKKTWEAIFDYLYEEDIETEHDGIINYMDNIAGEHGAVGEFLQFGSSRKCSNEHYNNEQFKSNVLIEAWRTEQLCWYPDYTYVGLEIRESVRKKK